MSDRPPKLRPNEVALRPGYHSTQVDVSTRLNTNEAPEGPPETWATDLAAEIIRLAANRYPDRDAVALRDGLAVLHGVERENVFCANGSNEAIQSLYLAYGGPARSALVFEPTYALHSHIARLTGTTVVAADRDEDFYVPLESALGLLERHHPELTLLCSPNNPTGASEPPATISALAAAVPGLLIVDEAYGQFAQATALDLINDTPEVVVVRTFSKTWAMAGIRLGYLIAHPDVVSACEQVALPYHLDAVKQVAGTLALRYEPEMRGRIANIVEERARVAEGLTGLGITVWPSDANFILFRVPDGNSRIVWESLVAQSVLVRDVGSWPRLQGCLRVTIGSRDENAHFLRALRTALVAD